MGKASRTKKEQKEKQPIAELHITLFSDGSSQVTGPLDNPWAIMDLTKIALNSCTDRQQQRIEQMNKQKILTPQQGLVLPA